ncbi:MAG: glutathione synthase [Burkholderiales bacterium]
MQLLFIIDPLASLKAYKDSTVAMMREAQSRSHAVHVCEQGSLALSGGVVSAATTQLTLLADDKDWYRAASPGSRTLASFDATVMRKDPPFDLEYVASTWLLEAAERSGARVFNRPAALRDHNEKLAITEFPQFVAPTLVTREPERIQAFIEEHGDAVLKHLDGMGGASIFRVRTDDPNRNVIVETMAEFGARSVMAQRYIPAIKDGDKRVLLIGGKVVPYALARIPKAGESRGNLAAGGRGVAQPLSKRDLEIAETLAPQLAPRGLLLVGLDVIGDYLTEVNVTSPTCFREIMDQTGCNVAGLFVDALEQAVARGAQ